MLQYLIILLDDTSVSFCHYDNRAQQPRLISLDDLKSGIVFAMKQNLMIQFVYPDYKLPTEYLELINTIDSHKIMPSSLSSSEADVVVLDSIENAEKRSADKSLVLRVGKSAFFASVDRIANLLTKSDRLNLILTDIETFTDADFERYKQCLKTLSEAVKDACYDGKFPQINLLSDRILLDMMNNCNAGVEVITLAPNGKFYICPAFYYDDTNDSIGDLEHGITMKNSMLYQLKYAPLCRNCDAFQCKRCVWLNRKTTHEVNTPSHEQCVLAHLERNASRKLLLELQEFDVFTEKSIKELDYLDPFDVLINNYKLT